MNPDIDWMEPDALAGFIELVAEIAHETNRTYCQSIGDDSQLPWNDAPDEQRDSLINGVRFHIENPDAGPEGSHENWFGYKQAEGWTYGPVKDPEAKTHPCMVPYDALPPSQQLKDDFFVGTVRAALSWARMLPSD